MRILTGIDISFMPTSGSPIICNDWYSNLPEDIKVRFLALIPDKGHEGWWTINDVVFLNIEKEKSVDKYPEYIEKLKAEIKKQISEFRPDLAHCQHLNFGFSRAVAELDDLAIPKIGICHGTDVQLATKSEFFMKNMKFIAERMDMLLFPTQNMKKDYFRYHDLKKKFVIIPLGIPDSVFSSRDSPIYYDWSRKPMKILYAGRLTSFKGVHIIVSAMCYVPENVNLTIIGNEDEIGYKEFLLKEIEKNQIQNKVTFIDLINRYELWEKFKEFDFIVFPSTELESFSLTTIEAQARGLVVAYHKNGGGIENTVGNSGVRVYENTPQAWAYTLRLIYHNPGILYNYRSLGFKNAEQYRLPSIRKKFFDISRRSINVSLRDG